MRVRGGERAVAGVKIAGGSGRQMLSKRRMLCYNIC